jgi:uncharacterized membrane protein
MTHGPIVTPPPDTLNSALQRNIDALQRRREQERSAAPWSQRLARRITAFAGSMRFVAVHGLLYGGWILLNLELLPAVEPWDPTFVVLAMIASVEAIFLSTFILITQNQMAAAADQRAELDVQISLLAEQEITKLVQLTAKIADRVGVVDSEQPEIEEMKRGVAPEAVLDAIADTERRGAETVR